MDPKGAFHHPFIVLPIVDFFLKNIRMNSKAFGSSATGSGNVRPILPVVVHKMMLQCHKSMDSFSNLSMRDVSGAVLKNEPWSPSDPEKKPGYYFDLSYTVLSTSCETKVNNDSL